MLKAPHGTSFNKRETGPHSLPCYSAGWPLFAWKLIYAIPACTQLCLLGPMT